MLNFPQKLSQTKLLLEKFILQDGVNVIDPDSTWISPTVSIGRGTVIYPNSYLIGNTSSIIGENCEIGPSAYLRDWFRVGSRVKIGFNAEVTRSIICNETKIPHFCHVGDSVIGHYCNIAAGTVFCNYDGNKKQRITIGDYVFIGSGVNLIAPVVIGDHAYIAAGAIVSKDVKPHDLIIGVNKAVEGKRSYYQYRSGDSNWNIST
ncbi:MAG: DapH/DapD/GlmU-related protein [Candidatus Azambacteria bacterium]|nr:DapH/DapD/GlmU-related protein [Candidatus Azambacteria bacterium]